MLFSCHILEDFFMFRLGNEKIEARAVDTPSGNYTATE